MCGCVREGEEWGKCIVAFKTQVMPQRKTCNNFKVRNTANLYQQTIFHSLLNNKSHKSWVLIFNQGKVGDDKRKETGKREKEEGDREERERERSSHGGDGRTECGVVGICGFSSSQSDDLSCGCQHGRQRRGNILLGDIQCGLLPLDRGLEEGGREGGGYFVYTHTHLLS